MKKKEKVSKAKSPGTAKKRKKAEEAPHHSEERYRTILENIQEGYFEVDLAGNFTFFNDSTCRLYGYSKEEMMGMNNRQYTDKENAKKLFQAFNKVYNTGESNKEFSWQAIRKDGTKRYLEGSISLQKDASGKPIGFRGIGHDITERKKAEFQSAATLEALRKSEESYTRLVNTIPDLVIRTDLEGNIFFVNDHTLQLGGYSREEVEGKNILKFISPENHEQVIKNLTLILEDGLGPKEYTLLTKDGSKIPFEVNGDVLRNEDGKPFGIVIVCRNITERKMAEEKLRFEEQRFRAFVENSSDIIVLINLKGIITYINPAVERVLGFKPEERIGAKGFELVHPDDMKFLADSFNTLAKDTNSPLLKGEMHLRHKDGSWRTLEAVGSNLVHNNVVEAIIVNYRDITERKIAEEELKKSEQRYLELSILDDLTQLYNSRHFYAQLEREMERSNRYEQPFTLLMLDLDKFKSFNDTYGHVEGDHVLSQLGQVVKRCLRETDSAYRYGGEEFTIMLPMTIREEGIITAKRIQSELRKEAFSPVFDQKVYMTVSIGVAQYKPKEEMKAFVQRVDQLMYQAKKNGRNTICSES